MKLLHLRDSQLFILESNIRFSEGILGRWYTLSSESVFVRRQSLSQNLCKVCRDNDVDHDDDDDDDHDELFSWNGWPAKGFHPYFQSGPLLERLTFTNLRHATSRIWTCREPDIRFSWMKLCSSNNYFTTVPLIKSCNSLVL